MKLIKIFLSIGVAVIYALNVAEAQVSAPVTSVVTPVSTSIVQFSTVLDLFKDQQKYVPAQRFLDAIKKLDIESRKSFSNQASALAGESKTLLQDALEIYFRSEQSMYEWCGVAVERFQSYVRLLQNFSLGKARMQQRIIIQVLEEGIRKYSEANEVLFYASARFNKAADSVAKLKAQLDTDFSAKSDTINNEIQRLSKTQTCVFWVCWNKAPTDEIDKLKKELDNHLKIIQQFDENLKNALVNAGEKIDKTKNKLKDEIRVLGEVKTQAQISLGDIKDIKDIRELEDAIQNEIKIPVQKLIEECKKFREQYITEKESFDAM